MTVGEHLLNSAATGYPPGSVNQIGEARKRVTNPMHKAESTEQDDEKQDAQGADTTDETAISTGATPAGDEGEEGTGDGVVVTIGDAAPASEEDELGPEATDAQRTKFGAMRKAKKEAEKRARDLEAQLAKAAQPAPGSKAAEVGEKPTLAGCDYDDAKFEADLLAWNKRKQEADDEAKATAKEEEEAQKAWQAKRAGYEQAKADLKLADFDDAEADLKSLFTVAQQSILLIGANNAALLVYALGKNVAKAKELAAIKDPVQFAFAAARLETQVKTTPRKATPAPDAPLKGNKSAGGVSSEATLARLEVDAEKSGDRSKVIAFKRAQRQAAG